MPLSKEQTRKLSRWRRRNSSSCSPRTRGAKVESGDEGLSGATVGADHRQSQPKDPVVPQVEVHEAREVCEGPGEITGCEV
ncbi:hypothetical protein CRG98_015973 [Punica granatum]|uniref:Uncharacterized protein n=1 Tax=Punica granatum TaxID=22663 RepID=A0A2I0K7G9_PUNGR|nr:hypothetical protein CRG98_015973 [Punica granatum]